MSGLDRLPARPLLTVCYLALLAELGAEHLLLAPAGVSAAGALVLALLKALPLLAFAPWLWRRGSGSPLGLSLVLLVYLCFAVLGSFAHGLPGQLALLRLLFECGLIGACLLVLRRPGGARA